MSWNLMFFINSILLGVGLAMDAFSVSLANGLGEPQMRRKKMCLIAGVFALFQALMPMTGWVCVHTIVQIFRSFEAFIPWIALFLLVYIGSKMIIESREEGKDVEVHAGIQQKGIDSRQSSHLTGAALLLQGIATSIDALSVGFTIADYPLIMALVCSLIIAAVTYIICMAGLLLGKRFGTRFAGKASVLGGVILIIIGFEILIRAVFF